MKALYAVLLAVMASLFSVQASAAIVVTELVTAINDSLTPIGLVAIAVLTVVVGTKVYHYIRRAL